jgi:hypothetical protein
LIAVNWRQLARALARQGRKFCRTPGAPSKSSLPGAHRSSKWLNEPSLNAKAEFVGVKD